jgi:hypothetical protein
MKRVQVIAKSGLGHRSVRVGSCTVGVGLIVLLGVVVSASAAIQKSSGFGVLPTQVIEAKQKTRKVDRKPGRPITEELLPTDEVLQVEEWQPPGVPPRPPQGRSRLQQMTIEASAVFVVTVDSVTGTLSLEGDWIDSSVVAAVSQVLKNSDPPAQSGHLLTFGATGGEIAIGSQKIRATLKDNHPFEPGRSYLVFLREEGKQLWAYSAEVALIDGTELVPLSPEGRFKFPSNDKDAVLDEIIKHVPARK